MGLVKAILTKSTFNRRVKAMGKKHAFLGTRGSCMDGIMPGWLPLAEAFLAELDELADGAVTFCLLDVRKSEWGVVSPGVYVETSLPPTSGRRVAIEILINEYKSDLGRVCKYCGLESKADQKIDESKACAAHKSIKSGMFEGDVKYDESQANEIKEQSGMYVKPDLLSTAIEAMGLLINPEYQFVDLSINDAVMNLETLLRKYSANPDQLVMKGKYEEEAEKQLSALSDALYRIEHPIDDDEVVPAVEGDAVVAVCPTLSLYKAADLEDMWQKSQSRDRKTMIEPYYKKAKELGTERRFALLSPTWREDLDGLAEDFPNFAEAGVIEFFKQQFALAARGDGRINLPPIVFLGSPGIGKTLLAQVFAQELCKTSNIFVSLASEQNGSAFSGSSVYWANTSPGKISTVLLMHEMANPVVVIDELDKVSKNNTHDPLAGLYSLLEPITARAFEDLCLGFQIDTSAINWVFTANDISDLPVPILSRVKVFEIKAPNKEQTVQIARRVYAGLLKSHWGGAFDPALPDDVADALGVREPRAIRSTLLAALGNAAIDERSTLEVADLDGVNRAVKSGDYQDSKIGFAARG